MASAKKRRTTACIYARTSREDKHIEKASIEQQIIGCQKKAEEKGFNVPKEYIFVDRGITSSRPPKHIAKGKQKTRPGLTECLDVLLSGKAQAIIVRDIDRLARKLQHNIDIIELFKQKHIEIVLTDSSFDFSTDAAGELSLNMLLAVMQYHLTRHQEYGRKTYRDKVRSGKKFNSASNIFGYDDVRDKDGKPLQNEIKINEEQAEVVRYMFRKYDEGMSIYNITDLLNEKYRKVSNKKRKYGRWDYIVVKHILHRPLYCSKAWNSYSKKEKSRELIDSVYPEIISFDLWKRCYDKLSVKPSRIFPKKKTYLMTSRVVCASCGQNLRQHGEGAGQIKSNSKPIPRYKCTNKACTNKPFSMRYEEWARFFDVFLGARAIKEFIQQEAKKKRPVSQSDTVRLANLQENLRGIENEISSGNETLDNSKELMAKIKQNIATIVNKNKMWQGEQASRSILLASQKKRFKQLNIVQQSELLDYLIESVEAYKDYIIIKLHGSAAQYRFSLLQVWTGHAYKFALLPQSNYQRLINDINACIEHFDKLFDATRKKGMLKGKTLIGIVFIKKSPAKSGKKVASKDKWRYVNSTMDDIVEYMKTHTGIGMKGMKRLPPPPPAITFPRV